MAYKQKTKQYIINAAKQPPYLVLDDIVLLNLNANFPKKDNFNKLHTNLKEIKQITNTLNLCNLASLCYKFNMDYASQETLDFIKNIIGIIKQEQFNIVQQNMLNCGEIDMKPISKLVSYDKEHNIIYCNSVLLDCLNILGYVDNQLSDVIDFCKNLRIIIPPDLEQHLPIETKKTLGCYNMIKEMLC